MGKTKIDHGIGSPSAIPNNLPIFQDMEPEESLDLNGIVRYFNFSHLSSPPMEAITLFLHDRPQKYHRQVFSFAGPNISCHVSLLKDLWPRIQQCPEKTGSVPFLDRQNTS